MNRLVRQIEAIGHEGGRTSAVRVYVLTYFRNAACGAGHAAVQHGPLDGEAIEQCTLHAA
jgi:hypothetical protein